MANESMSIADKQYLAKILYTREKLEQKIIAKKVGVSEKTISKWVNDFNWRNLRNRLIVGKEEVLGNLYEQIAALQDDIKANGKKYGDTKQADILVKYTAAIRSLETELAIADLVDSGIKFTRFIQRISTLDKVIEVTDLWDAFIKDSLKG